MGDLPSSQMCFVGEAHLAAGQDKPATFNKDLPDVALGQGYEKIIMHLFKLTYFFFWQKIYVGPKSWTHIVISQPGNVGKACSSGFELSSSIPLT